MATVYKTFTVDEMNSRTVEALSAEDTQKVNQVLTDFVTYFKNKHL